ncbi:hypothetical protein [Ekhidna sp.]
MRYLVNITSEVAVEYASLLLSEILRFDVRAEIDLNQSGQVISYEEADLKCSKKPIKKSKLKRSYDLILVIGDDFNNAFLSDCKKCFIQVTTNFKEGKKINIKALNSFDRVYTDLPSYSKKNIHIGHFFNDVIRKHNFEEQTSDLPVIGISLTSKRNLDKVAKLVREASRKVDCTWSIYRNGIDINKLQNLEKVDFVSSQLDQLKNSAICIVDSELNSIASTLLNCPQITISSNIGFLGLRKSKALIINELLDEGLLRSFSSNQIEDIIDEIQLILNDHEYCASMLTAYQRFKEKVGTGPVIRETARDIVEWIEEDVA